MTPATATVDDVHYPSSDGKPMAETQVHVRVMAHVLTTLEQHFADRDNVHVAANLFLFYQRRVPGAVRSPDVMVTFGIPRLPLRESFRLWDEGKAPDFVLELTSESSREEDQGPKRELYLRLGVREYFLFDPFHEWLPRQLMGYMLHRVTDDAEELPEDLDAVEVTSVYEEIPPARDGSIFSSVLQLRLVPDGEHLRLYSGRRELLGLADLSAAMDRIREQAATNDHLRAEAELQLAAERARAETERARADAERARAEAERARADEATHEITQLREQLARFLAQQPPPS